MTDCPTLHPSPDRSEKNCTLLDLAGRIMLTHRIPSDLAATALSIGRCDADSLVKTGRLSRPFDVDRADRLQLFVNVLLRLEWRLQHDSRAIRHALHEPCDTLDGRSPAQMLGGSLDDLRAVRRASNGGGSVTERRSRRLHRRAADRRPHGEGEF